MKTTLLLIFAIALMCVAPAFAQEGAFTDVPGDHWAYDAVNTLQSAGLVQGYPNGTFQGKRTLSRYEFAMVIARMLPLIGQSNTSGIPTGFVKKSDLDSALSGYVKKSDTPAIGASKADLDAVRKLVDEFRDEIAALGVDVDSVKRDVAALADRVAAVEAEQARVKVTGDLNIIAKATADSTDEVAYDEAYATADFSGLRDKDGRDARNTAILRDVNIYRDFDLNIKGKVNANTDAVVSLNYGNYVSYLNGYDVTDEVTPYYMYVKTDVGFGKLTIGRFPLQLGNYTFKMVDPDSYTTLAKTDSGNMAVDGAKVTADAFGIDWTFFAVQHNQVAKVIGFNNIPFDQSAGVNAKLSTPFDGKLGLTYYQGWNKEAYEASAPDTMSVYGADYSMPFHFLGGIGLQASWAQSHVNGVEADDQALDAKLTGGVGSVSLGAGYKWIGADFAAPGYWDTIGQAKNPTNVKGVTVDAGFKVNNIGFNACAELLKAKNVGGLFVSTDDKVNKIAGGIKWDYSKKASFGVDYELVQFDLTGNVDKPEESYLTLNWNRNLGNNANLKVGYQFINYDAGSVDNVTSPYGSDYKGGLGVVQMGVSF